MHISAEHGKAKFCIHLVRSEQGTRGCHCCATFNKEEFEHFDSIISGGAVIEDRDVGKKKHADENDRDIDATLASAASILHDRWFLAYLHKNACKTVG